MVRRDVQRAEIVEVVLDLGARHRREALLGEQPLDARDRARERVQAAGGLAAARQRDVERLGRELARHRRVGDRALARVDQRGDLVLGAVHALAERLALVRRHGAELLEQLGHAAFLAE
jgi:hypothetical protein